MNIFFEMCGICGFITKCDFNYSDTINSMLASISHRGKEASKSWSDDFIYLGHNRLSIQDPDSRADQPMISSNKRYVIVFNGEIYNFKELAKELVDFKPNTSSDTEILLELWNREQINCLTKLNGMFAFVIYDRLDQSITCVRDRLGVKPFYYYYDGNSFVFASEAKAILRVPIYNKKLNYKALSDYLSYGYITGPETIFSDIKKLEPAHYIILKTGSFEKKRYWNLLEEASKRTSASNDELLDLFKSSIKYRQISDVPVGSFLSSGIDSSAVSLFAAQNNQNLLTFTIGFNEESFDESKLAQEFANKNNLVNHTTKLTIPTIDDLQRIIGYFDQPFFDTSTIPFFYLCKIASQRIKTALTGDGGDEIFAGYETRKADLASLIAHKLPYWPIISRIIARLLNQIPSNTKKVSLNYKLKQFFNFAYLPEEKAHYSWRLLFTEEEKNLLLDKNIIKSLNNYESWSNFESVFSKYQHLPMLQREALVDINTWLADDILYKADQCSMANTLELRSPFLDYRLVEAAFSIPEKSKFSLIKGKKLLRNILKPVLDKAILKQKKEGFGSPVGEWLKGLLKEPFYDYINSKSFKELIPSTKTVYQLFDQHLNMKRDNSFRLWALFMLALWQNRWLT